MKDVDHYFLSILISILISMLQTKLLNIIVQMKATDQYFPVVLFITLYKVIPSFESVDEILKCDYSNKSC